MQQAGCNRYTQTISIKSFLSSQVKYQVLPRVILMLLCVCQEGKTPTPLQGVKPMGDDPMALLGLEGAPKRDFYHKSSSQQHLDIVHQPFPGHIGQWRARIVL